MDMIDETDSLDLEILQQLDNIIRHEGSIFTEKSYHAFKSLGLMDPEQLPSLCRFAAFKRIGEEMLNVISDDSPIHFDSHAVLAIRLGLLHRLFDQVKTHAETRIMFRRPLACQPTIMLRMVELRALLCFLDEATEYWIRFSTMAPGQAKLGINLSDLLAWIRNSGKFFQNGCQQISGGTGYMMESGLAHTVRALDKADLALRAMEMPVYPCSTIENSFFVSPQHRSWMHPFSRESLHLLIQKGLIPIAKFDDVAAFELKNTMIFDQLLSNMI